MSFVRKSVNPPKKKKVAVRKPKPWDDTLNDLNAYKATPEEIEYRKAIHRSKFAVSTHLNRGPGSGKKGKRPGGSHTQARKIAIMKEVLHDQRQLQDVLERSDTMMAVVKDLFGDDPRRFAGIPSVTSAPNSQEADVSSSLVKLPAPIRTRSEVLSDSMVDSSALNDFKDSDSEGEDSRPAPLTYQPKMNMQRFQQFLEAEERNNTLSTISGQAGLSHLGQPLISRGPQGFIQSSQLPDQSELTSKDGTFETPSKNDGNESIEILRPPKSAMNDTEKVNKTKRRIPRPEPESNTSNFSLNDLRKVLETLENEISDYETQTGRRPPAERNRQDSFSGYTLAIVDSVTKLTRYLKECEMRLQAETTIREQLAQDVVQFKALVDALTSDIIVTQEEFHKMADEFQRFRRDTQAELQQLRGNQQTDGASTVRSRPNSAEPVSMTTPPKSQQYQRIPESNMATDQAGVDLRLFGEHLKPVSSAVMLSPPVRRSHVMEGERDAVVERQGNLIDVPEYISSAESNNSATQDSYAELPGVCPTSLAPSSNPYHVPSQLSTMSSSQPTQQIAPAATVNSISVPRPTPLVQSNVAIPLSQDSIVSTDSRSDQQLPLSFMQKHLPVSIVPGDRPQNLQQRAQNPPVSMSHDQGQQGADREFLASQIAALNRQHAEAQKRLQGLMVRQGQEQPSQDQHSLQQQQQHQRQQLVNNQQRLQQQQLQYEQQQKLIALVLQQQQKIQQQKQQTVPQQQQQAPPQPAQRGQLPRPNIPQEYEAEPVRQSAEMPGYQPPSRQTGLPAYPVSPNISPISQRSEAQRAVYQSIDSQNGSMMVPASRGITVALPQVEMDMSGGSPSPQPPKTVR